MEYFGTLIAYAFSIATSFKMWKRMHEEREPPPERSLVVIQGLTHLNTFHTTQLILPQSKTDHPQISPQKWLKKAFLRLQSGRDDEALTLREGAGIWKNSWSSAISVDLPVTNEAELISPA